MEIYLETDRLILRRLTDADVENLFVLDSDPAVMRFINGGKLTPREVIETETLPRLLGEYRRVDGYGLWAAIEKSTGEFIGWLSLRAHEGDLEKVELGYRLRQSAWATPPRVRRLSSTKASPNSASSASCHDDDRQCSLATRHGEGGTEVRSHVLRIVARNDRRNRRRRRRVRADAIGVGA